MFHPFCIIQNTISKGEKQHWLMHYTPINDLLYFPHFSWVWNLTSSFTSGPCVTTSFPPHPVIPPPFTHAPWCLKYGCCFYIKCCYQSTTWITMNNVSCICHQGDKDQTSNRARLIIGVAAQLVVDVGSKQKGGKKHTESPCVCFVFSLHCAHLFHLGCALLPGGAQAQVRDGGLRF